MSCLDLAGDSVVSVTLWDLFSWQGPAPRPGCFDRALSLSGRIGKGLSRME